MVLSEQKATGRHGSGGLMVRGLLSPHGFLGPATGSSITADGRAAARSPLPLVQLIAARSMQESFLAATSVDDRGRLADRTALKELGWRPGTPVAISMIPAAGVLVVRRNGPDVITSQGHLRLPAPIRHGLRLRANDRLLLLALVHDDVLVAYLASALEDMVSAYHAGITEQETR
jgi:hypothetical protein